MVNEAVNRGRSGHRVFENPFPLGERQIAGDEDAAALKPLPFLRGFGARSRDRR